MLKLGSGKAIGAGVSEAVFEYAWEGGFVSSKDFRIVVVFNVSDLLWDMVGVEIVWGPADGVLLSHVSDCANVLELFDSVAGELCTVRFKLPEEGRLRIDGSDKLARALVVLSRANAANENNPPRFCFEEAGECVD